MSKLWLMARHTYVKRVRSGAFLLLTFGIPLLMVVVGGVAALRAGGAERLHLGYVDETGRLPHDPGVSPTGVQVTALPERNAARLAVESGEVDGVLIVPQGYLDGEAPLYLAAEAPSDLVRAAAAALLRDALLADQPAWLAQRIENPADVTYTALDTDERITNNTSLIIRVLFPIVIAVLLALTIFSTVSQTGAAVVQEKEERAMEIVITSLAPWQLVAGKVLGMTLLSMTQVGIWAIGSAVALILLGTRVSGGAGLAIPWYALVWAVLLGVPGYFLFAVLAAGLGVIAGDRQHAQQLAGSLGILSMVPLWFGGALVGAPDGSLAVALSLIPFTSPTVLLFRLALTDVPAWQLLAALGILLVSLGLGVWVVAHIFRAAMLLYGQTLSPRQVWRALQAG